MVNAVMSSILEKIDDNRITGRESRRTSPVSLPTQLDTSNADEALKVVGAQRTAKFSDEYNIKLRRKIVGRT